MMKLAVIGLGGAIGAVLRYSISDAVHGRWGSSFPYGTLLVNVIGCLCIGALIQAMSNMSDTHSVRVFAITGLLGAFTTFSAFGYETVTLIERQAHRAALLNVTMNVVLGIAAVVVGSQLIKVFVK